MVPVSNHVFFATSFFFPSPPLQRYVSELAEVVVINLSPTLLHQCNSTVGFSPPLALIGCFTVYFQIDGILLFGVQNFVLLWWRQPSKPKMHFIHKIHGNKCNGRGRDFVVCIFYPYHFHAPCCRFALNLFFCPSLTLPHLCVFLIRFCSSLLHGLEVKSGADLLPPWALQVFIQTKRGFTLGPDLHKSQFFFGI